MGEFFLNTLKSSDFLINPWYSRSVALIPENSEDIWHAYNIICDGDLVKASTIRKVGFPSLFLSCFYWFVFRYKTKQRLDLPPAVV
jgi:hypothetical protein